MLDSKELAIRGRLLADQVVAFAREHEEAEHSGDVCARNRVSIIAYLMHCLGLNTGQGQSLYAAIDELLKEYEDHCPNCPHGKIEG